jgi:AcrR family transcriptional regulator
MKEAGTTSTPSSKRRYDSHGRQEEAMARRRRIIDEAHRLFLRDGYAATSLDGIAAAARVSVQTLYAAFTSKAGLLAKVIDIAIGGDDQDVMVRDRPEFRAILDASTPEAFLRAAVRHGRKVHERSGPIMHLLEQVAGTDPALAALAAELRRQSREESAFVVDHVPAEWFRPGFTREERITATYLLGYYQTWWALTQELGWSAKRYESYVARLLGLLLVDPPGD